MIRQKVLRRLNGMTSALIRRILIGRVPKLFDEQFYLRENEDVARWGVDPFLHYVWRGAAQNRDAAEDFDTAFFRAQSGQTRLDPVRHYLRFGAVAGLDPNPGFSSASYLIRYPDIANFGINPLLHYRTNGRREGRVASPSASKTFQIPALRTVPTRYILKLPSKAGHPFTIKLLRQLAVDENFKLVPRLCIFLSLTHDEVTTLVSALDAMRAGSLAEITLDVVEGLGSSVSTVQFTENSGHHARPQLDTILLAFERCYFASEGCAGRIIYAELRLWDLRGQEARVAEIFPTGSLEFKS